MGFFVPDTSRLLRIILIACFAAIFFSLLGDTVLCKYCAVKMGYELDFSKRPSWLIALWTDCLLKIVLDPVSCSCE